MLLNEFSVIFDRPEKVKKLREYILSLAVRGKLVEQDENDEPASVLLERIREEKDRLVKEKKIKKEKALPEINEDEILHELPKDWVWVRLGELGNIFNGNSINAKLKESKYSNLKEGYNYIATKDVDLQSRTINYENGIKIPYDEEKFRIAHEGAILICAEGGSAGKKIGLVEEDICFGNKLLAIELFYETNSKYLFYLYQSPDFYERFSELMTGIIGGISSKNFKEILVSLPPLKEQKRIVEKVDYLMEFCDKLEIQLEKKVKYGSLSAKSVLNGVSNCSSYEELEEALKFIIENFKDLTLADGAVGELKNAILSLAVKGKLVPQDESDEPASVLVERIREEKERLVKDKKIKKEKLLPEISEDEIPYEVPKGWEWKKLGELFIISRGSSPRPKGSPLYWSNERTKYHWITISDITKKSKGNILVDTEEFLTEEGSKLSRYAEKGEIIVTISGSTVGKSSILGLDGYIYDGLAVIKNINKNEILRDYIFVFLLAWRNKINQQSEGSAFPNINTDKLNKIAIPMPPLNEQKRIIENVDKLMKICDELELRIEKSKKYSEKLMESILKDSFKA